MTHSEEHKGQKNKKKKKKITICEENKEGDIFQRIFVETNPTIYTFSLDREKNRMRIAHSAYSRRHRL
jgi:hypothetical protein